MMWLPSKELNGLWEQADEAYKKGDLEEYEKLNAKYMELYAKESEEHRNKMPIGFC